MDVNVENMYKMAKEGIEKTIACLKERGVDTTESELCLSKLKANYEAFKEETKIEC